MISVNRWRSGWSDWEFGFLANGHMYLSLAARERLSAAVVTRDASAPVRRGKDNGYHLRWHVT
jgi:hypothetical protein